MPNIAGKLLDMLNNHNSLDKGNCQMQELFHATMPKAQIDSFAIEHL